MVAVLAVLLTSRGGGEVQIVEVVKEVPVEKVVTLPAMRGGADVGADVGADASRRGRESSREGSDSESYAPGPGQGG